MNVACVNTALSTTLLNTELKRLNDEQITIDHRYIVKGLLKPGQVSMIFGPSNVGKSTVVASICAHVAQGKPLANIPTEKSLVIYVAAEDPKGVEDRALPHFTDAASDSASFYVLPKSIDLTDPQQMAFLSKEIQDLIFNERATSCLVIVDTMAMSIGDGDENSARDMGRMIQSLRRIADETGANALVVHHTGVSDGSRPRGSGTVFNAFDTVVLVEDASKAHGRGVVSLTPTKQRNGSKNRRLYFRLTALEVGIDRDGEAITLPLALPMEGQEVQQTPSAGDDDATEADAGDYREKVALQLVCQQCKASPDRRVKAADIIADFSKACPSDKSEKRETILRAINRIFAQLVQSRLIEGNGNAGYRPTASAEKCGAS